MSDQAQVESLKVLVTGGNGFIGSHLAEELVTRNALVSLLDLQFSANTEGINCDKIVGDVRDYDEVWKAVRGKDIVFHLGAVSRVIWGQEQPLNCWQTNLLGTVNVLEAARRAETRPIVFYASSREVYGEPRYLPVDEAHLKNPKSVYGTSKLCAEKACISYHNAFGVKTVVLRFSNVYGSDRDQLDRVAPNFMLKALANDPITLYGGTQVLDFSFIDDVISGILLAYDKACTQAGDIVGTDLHFVTGMGVSVSDLAEKIVKTCGSSSIITKEDSRSFEVQSFVGNPQKAHAVLGYSPRIELERGLLTLKQRLGRQTKA
jgi:nucleoside-diphosphate-sugar epimerase